MKGKLMDMEKAISQYVNDGDTVHIGGFVHGVPNAAVHEIIRQKKKNLTVTTLGGTLFMDQLIGAGCVDKIITCYIWNNVPLPAHAFRRAIEKGIPNKVELEEYSLLGMNIAYFAGAMGLPFIATKTMLGTDFISKNSFLGEKKLKVINSPFDGEKVCLIPPIKHDVGILHLQRADIYGNAQMWGFFGGIKYGLLSSDKIIISTEEIVDQKTIRRDPNRTIIPAYRVSAVVEEPWGAHPEYVQGYYDRDWEFFPHYEKLTRTEEGCKEFLNDWVFGVTKRKEYIKKLGSKRLRKLRARKNLSRPVNYGYFDSY
jgi:glutaconate CoA-transferase subunit A